MVVSEDQNILFNFKIMLNDNLLDFEIAKTYLQKHPCACLKIATEEQITDTLNTKHCAPTKDKLWNDTNCLKAQRRTGGCQLKSQILYVSITSEEEGDRGDR